MEAHIQIRDLPVYFGPQSDAHRTRPDSVMPIVARIVADMELAGAPTLTVTFNYRPGTPDVLTLPNGDPGYPGDPAELEILEVTCPNILCWSTDGFMLTADAGTNVAGLFDKAGREWLEAQCIEQAHQQAEDDAADAAIDRYQHEQYMAEHH